MPITTVKPLLAEAEALLTESKFRSMDDLIDMCAMGLGFLAREAETYDKDIRFCAGIAPHFINELTALVHILNNTATGPWLSFSFFGEVQIRAFALVEDMALFMREKKLRAGCKRQHPTEERILVFFESSGNWPADNGEIVTDTYYKQLPVAVIHDLLVTASETPTVS